MYDENCENENFTEREELELLRAIIKAIPQPLCLFDRQKNLLKILNLSEDKLVKHGVYEFIGHNMGSLVVDESSPYYKSLNLLNTAIDSVLETGEPCTYRYDHDGLYFESRISAVGDKYLVSYVRNISQEIKDQIESERVIRNELSLALTAGGLSSWAYDVDKKELSSSHENNIIGRRVSLDDCLEKIVPSCRNSVLEMFAKIIDQGYDHSEATVCIKDLYGKYVWVNIFAMPQYYDKNGRVIGIVGSQKDVTESIADEALRNELIKQNTIVKDNANAGFVFVTSDYKVAWENITRLFPPELEDGSYFYEQGELCYKNEQKLSGSDTKSIIEFCFKERQIKKLEKQLPNSLYVELTAIPVFSEDGIVDGVVLKIEDISDRIKVQKQLEYNNTVMELTFLAGRIIPWEWDVNTKIMHSNDGSSIFNDKGMLLEDYAKKYVHEDHKEVFKEACDNIISGRTDIIDCKIQTKRGAVYDWVHIVGRMVSDPKTNQPKAVGITRIITDEVYKQEELAFAKKRAEQSDALKSAFVANMSHEIRTPLNAVVGFAQLIHEVDEEEREAYIEIINSNCELLLRLINDILDLSKIEAGYVDCTNTEFDLSTVFNELELIMSNRVKPGVKLINSVKDKKSIVNIDKQRIAQVLTNFTTNAIKFTKAGSIEIGYDVVDNGVKIFVKDTGCGINETNQQKVFDRFEKFDAFEQGAGLGMAICKAIVDSYEGEIGIISTPGEGSTFWAMFPTKVTVLK